MTDSAAKIEMTPRPIPALANLFEVSVAAVARLFFAHEVGDGRAPLPVAYVAMLIEDMRDMHRALGEALAKLDEAASAPRH